MEYVKDVKESIFIGRIDMGTLPKFGPKGADHPSAYTICPACHKVILPGQYTTLVPLGPGDDLEAQKRCQEGQPYNAVAIEVHYSCATGEE